jgi:hypothetical protein
LEKIVQPTVIYDSLVESYQVAGGTIWDPSIHTVLTGPGWIDRARRITRRPSLFLFYHREAQSVCLGDWIHKPNVGRGPGLFTELEVLRERGQKAIAYPSDGFLLERVSPLRGRAKSIRRRLQAAKEARRAMRAATDEERDWTIKHLEKKHGQMNPLVKNNFFFIGRDEGGEELRKMKDDLVNLSRVLRR